MSKRRTIRLSTIDNEEFHGRSRGEGLTFEQLTDGNQIYLNDGSARRIETTHRAIALLWQPGDPVEITEDKTKGFDQLITNLRTGSSVRAVKSARLEDGIHRWLRK